MKSPNNMAHHDKNLQMWRTT